MKALKMTNGSQHLFYEYTRPWNKKGWEPLP
jgi:hypothetical protein